jgi:hypothetical protein
MGAGNAMVEGAGAGAGCVLGVIGLILVALLGSCLLSMVFCGGMIYVGNQDTSLIKDFKIGPPANNKPGER